MKKIWIDLDNTPHVPFFRPIIGELDKLGYECFITARDAYQVLDLADRFGLRYKKVGRHFGKNKILKIAGTLVRSLEMIPIVTRQKPLLAVSHGSRTQLLAANLLHIPSLTLYDYEYVKAITTINPTYVMVPEIIPESAIRHPADRVFKYPGIKEDVYVCSFVPDSSIKKDLKIDDRALVVTVRPPATEAHYFCHASEELFESAMSFLLQKPNIQSIVIPRNKKQEDFIRATWSEAMDAGRITIPDHAVNGLDLMWFSDLVISGGGTMNREAAALGVPVYSIFRGTIGAVDKYLSQSGRLTLLEGPDDIEKKLLLCKRNMDHGLQQSSKPALKVIVEKIVEIIDQRRID